MYKIDGYNYKINKLCTRYMDTTTRSVQMCKIDGYNYKINTNVQDRFIQLQDQ